MYYIETKEVVKEYDQYRALDRVSIQVPQNGIYGLLGPNGAGKTTLIRIINQITAPDSGTVELLGRPLAPSDIAKIGYLPEERGLYKKMKVGEHIHFLARLKGVSSNDAKQRTQQLLEKFGIEEWGKKKVEELSKGMQQKVQFIATIIHRPELLIFDEPFSGFDPVNANILKEAILELKREGATVIFSTHNMSSVEELCSEITLINRSKMVLQGEVKAIRQAHKKGIFKVTTHEQSLQPIPNCFEILKQQEGAAGYESTIRCLSAIENNALIAQLIQQNQLVAFEEILPTMNEIFIETVKEEVEL